MSKERKQGQADNLPILAESKSKNYFFSPAKEYQRSNSHHQSKHPNASASDKSHFEEYMKAKYEKQILMEQQQSLQNKSNNSYANTMNTTMAQKIIEKIFVNSPTKKVTSQQIGTVSPTSQFFNKSGTNLSTKFTLKSMLINNQIGSSQVKNGLISQLNVNSPQKNKQIQLQQEGEQTNMKSKLMHQQWTSTVELQNLRSQGNIPTDNASKCTSPTKLRVSMPLIEEIQQLSQQEKIQQQKRNPATKQQQKQMQELSKVNKQLEKMKSNKTNSFHFLPSSSYIQSTLNSCQNICNTNVNFNSLQGTRTKIQNLKLNNEDESACSSITNLNNNNKQIKDPSLIEINWNSTEDIRARNKSLNFSTTTNTNTHANINTNSNLNLNTNGNIQYTSTLSQINSTRKEGNQEEDKSSQHQQQSQQQLSQQQYLINKPKLGKVINLLDTKNNSPLKQQNDQSNFSYQHLNSPKDEVQETENSKRQATQITSLNLIEANPKSESLIEIENQNKIKGNQLFLHIPQKKRFSSMIQFDVREEEIEETLGTKYGPKSMIFKNGQDKIIEDNSSNKVENDSLNKSKDDMDINNLPKQQPNIHQQLFKSKSNFIFFRKKSSGQQSGQHSGNQSPSPNSPLSPKMPPYEQNKSTYKLQLKAQSPTNSRKEMLIQQIFLQNQKTKVHSSNTISYQTSAIHSPHRRHSPLKSQEHLPPLNLHNTMNNTNPFSQQNQISPHMLTPNSELTPIITSSKNSTSPYILNLDMLRSASLPQNQLLDQSNSTSSMNTPKQLPSFQQVNTPSSQNRARQVSSIEIATNGGYHPNQGLLNQILKKSIKNFSKNRNLSNENQANNNNTNNNSNNNNNTNNINLKTLNSSSNSQFSNPSASANVTPVRNAQKKKTKINTNSYLQLEQSNKINFSNLVLISPQYESSPSISQNNTFIGEQTNNNNKKRLSNSIHTNQLRFTIDELCQGLEMYIVNDPEIMKELKQNETDSTSFSFYISKYLQLAQYELPNNNNNNLKSKDKLVLFKINTQLFEKVKQILQTKMNDMKIENNSKNRIMRIFEDSKSHILASNVFEEIGGKRQLRNLIQKVVQDIKENTNIPILNQFSDPKEMLDNATNFFMYLFNGDYEQIGILSNQFLENKFNVTLIEYFLLKNFTYNSLLKDKILNKEVTLRILEKIESVRSCLLPNYDDNTILNPESRIQSLLFDLSIHSIAVHKFIKPLKNKILPESQYDPFSYYLKQEVKYLITNPKLRKMARTVEANLKSKEDFFKVSYNFLDILKKQKSVKFTNNQLLNVEVRILKVGILLGLEDDYYGLFKDIGDLEHQLLEEIDQYHQQNSTKLNIQNMKQSMDIKFLSFIVEFTFNQYSVFNAYDISIAKKFYSLNHDIINAQITSLENLLLKRKNESLNFIQIQQKIPQFISLLKKIFIST